MNISRSDLEKLELYNLDDKSYGGKLYRDGNLLYKIFYDFGFFYDELIRNIDFQIKNHIVNTPFVYDKLYFEDFCSGYVMEYIDDSITFKEAIGRDFSFDKKMNAIMDFYKAIRYLHSNNICLGDIHLDNLLINKEGHGYVIDLDYLVFPGDEFKFCDKYLIRLNNHSYKINKESSYIDNIKAMICSLSLIYNVNLEDYMDDFSYELNIENVYEEIIRWFKEKYLDKYFRHLINGDNVRYFDEVLYNKFFKYNRNNSKLLKLSN